MKALSRQLIEFHRVQELSERFALGFDGRSIALDHEEQLFAFMSDRFTAVSGRFVDEQGREFTAVKGVGQSLIGQSVVPQSKRQAFSRSRELGTFWRYFQKVSNGLFERESELFQRCDRRDGNSPFNLRNKAHGQASA